MMTDEALIPAVELAELVLGLFEDAPLLAVERAAFARHLPGPALARSSVRFGHGSRPRIETQTMINGTTVAPDHASGSPLRSATFCPWEKDRV